ncbi:MAG TPA: GntR family transcriptional regulator [Candidatus Dormibacteraeota bacterium]|nr:GntR family transcriptional regulator [Candidatus Dormibacteraeota bacterium]
MAPNGFPPTLSIASVTEVVYDHLRGRILRGLAPGQPLRLNILAAELGVSTTPVRMALERLASDGLVIQAGRRGATVAPLSVADFQDIYAVRRCLEGAAARLGAALMTNAEREEMRQLSRRLQEIVQSTPPDLDQYLESEWQLHEVCYTACHYERMLAEIRSFRRQAERYFRLALAEGMNVLEDMDQQRDFCTACVSGDGGAAERVAIALLNWTVERVAPILANSRAMAPVR